MEAETTEDFELMSPGVVGRWEPRDGGWPPEAEPDHVPAGWDYAWDQTRERYYYFNRETEERVWSLKGIAPGVTTAAISDTAGRAECKRRTFRDLVHMQARATKELQNISQNMSSLCTELRHMRHEGSGSVQAPSVAGIQMTPSEKRWAQRRRDFHKRGCTEQLRQLFVQGGLNLDGRYTREELGAVVTTPRLQNFFQRALHVHEHFSEEVFLLLELDGEHRASLAEFIEGCVELKDEASVRETSAQLVSFRMTESMQAMSESMLRAYPGRDHPIRPLKPYDPKRLPEVEVAIRVNHLANVDTNMLKFEADFTVFLDWVDERIPDGVEAHQLDWVSEFFNPSIVVEGMEEGPMEPTPCSEHPLFARPETRANAELQKKQYEWLTRGQRECRWCTKMYRFRGVLCMPEVDLCFFPFDYQMLPLKVRAQRANFGNIANAFVRLASASLENLNGSAEELHIRRLCRQYNSREAKFRHNGSYCASTPSDSCMADCMVEFKIYGLYSFPARSLLDMSGEAFQVTVLVKRPVLGHQLGEFAVLVLLTLLSTVSFWDVASPDLSSRMSITLTIILTLAAYTSQRPTAIEKVPHATVQDKLELLAMFFVICVALMNVVTVVHCGGEHPEAPELMQAMYWEHQDICSEFRLGMRRIDFFCFVTFLAIVPLTFVVGMTAVYILRTRKLKRKLKEGVELLELMGGAPHPGSEMEDDLPTLSCHSGSSLRDQKNWDLRIEEKVQHILAHMNQERHRARNPSPALERSSTLPGMPSDTDSPTSAFQRAGSRVAPEPEPTY